MSRAAVIDDLLSHRSQAPGSTAVSFFFCEADHTESLIARTILGSLIRQCLSLNYLPEPVQAIIAQVFTNDEPDAEDLMQLLKSVSDIYQRQFIVIDGFDECSKADREILLDLLHRLLSSTQSSVKIFLASRDDTGRDIQRALKIDHQKMISCPEAQRDIESYVKGVLKEKIEQSELVVGDQELIISIQNALVKGAQSMSVSPLVVSKSVCKAYETRFLWVALQLQEICAQTCDQDIRSTIKSLPKDLSEAYERILSRVLRSGKANIAQKVYRWIAAVQRPLNLEELREAIAIEPCQAFFERDRLVNDISRVVTWCGSLVVFDEEDDSVRFAHHSIKDHFLSKPLIEEVKAFHFDLQEADEDVGVPTSQNS